jgi:hypothetical protein
MRTLTIAFAFLVSVIFSFAQKKENGWIRLFDGNTTTGWHNYGKAFVNKAWKVEDHAIHFDAGTNLDSAARKLYLEENHGDLVTDTEFKNFDLKIEWKISKNGNSGIIFYVKEDTSKFKETYNTGMEMQVLDNEGHADGKIHKHRAGDLYDLIPCSIETVKPVGEWNQVEIICNNGNLVFKLNGTTIVSTTLWDDGWKALIAGSKFKNMPDFGTFTKGRIALQNHGNDVWFRNITIKNL